MNATTRRTLAGGLLHLGTLEDAVADFHKHRAFRNDPVLAHTMAAGSLTEAIERACAGIAADGKKFRHDQYLRPSSVESLQRRLIKHMHTLPAAKDFDALHDLVQNLRPNGVGQLKVFDVTMRLGAYLKINLEHSKYVYLHRGALAGWQKLTSKRARPYRVLLDSIPAELQEMGPHYLIEDWFCEYRLWLLMRAAA
jgi:hypothetical protein